MNNGGNSTIFSVSSLLQIFILFVCLIFSSFSAATETEKFWTQANSFNWIHKITENKAPMQAYLNGELLENQTDIFVNHKGYVHARVHLTQNAESLIEIKQGDDILFKTILFQTSYFQSEIVPDDFPLLIFHQQENEAVCKDCHRLDIEDIDNHPASPKDSLCYGCHKHSFTTFKYLHTDVISKWLCLKCHQPEFAESDTIPDMILRFFIQEGDATAPLCYKCHTTKERKFAEDENIHGPIGMEGCTMCHNSHGSQFKNLLENDATTLCVDCHELQDMFEQPHVHPVLLQKGCTACHDAHSSKFRYQLLAETIDLCYKCHPKIKKNKNNHPVNGHPVSGSKNPMLPDEPFTCTSCHTPHSSENDNLLPESETMMVCIGCHPMGGGNP